MGRSPCCDKIGLKKGPWTPEEDQKLLAYIQHHGHGSWRALPAKAGLQRCGKSCRLRWTNYLRPDIKRGKFSLQEEQTIIQLHSLLGNRWSAIAAHLPKRTDNEIKNYWNTHLKKRLAKMGIDTVTHKPKNDAILSRGAGAGSGESKSAAKFSHMAQWEIARLEAEARLVRESKLRSSHSFLSSSSSSARHRPVLRAWNNGGWLKTTDQNLGSTSTLTLSYNTTPPIMPMIEFVGTSGSCEARIVKEEASQVTDNNNNSVFSTSSHVEGTWTSREPPIPDDQVLTSLLLNSNSDDRSLTLEDGSGGGNDDVVLCEENKNYWNSILNLVNSNSPSHSPIF